MTDEIRQEIIRAVIEELIRRGFVLPQARPVFSSQSGSNNEASNQNVPAVKTEHPFDIGRVLTEEKVEIAAKSRSRLSIPSSVVITPLARDRAKTLGLELVEE